MDLLFKPLVFLALFVQPFTSCHSQQRQSGNEPITRDLLLKLEPGKDYLLELKSGSTLEIYIQQISPERISGISYHYESRHKLTKLDYSETLETIEKNVASITLLKREPYINTKAIYDPTPPSPQVTYKPEEMIKIQKFQNMKKAGITLTVLGGLMITGGIIAGMNKDADAIGGPPADTKTEETVIGIGLAFAAPGALLWIMGSKKERKYKKELQGASVALGLNTYRPGLSIKIRF